MSNGSLAVYGRLFKLWGTVSKLVLDGKRDPWRLCDTLQAIVEQGSDVPSKVALSKIRSLAKQAPGAGRMADPAAFPASLDIIQSLALPYIEFRTDDDSIRDDLHLVPKHVGVDAPQGSKVFIDGDAFVIVENNRNHGVNIMMLVPATRVDETS